MIQRVFQSRVIFKHHFRQPRILFGGACLNRSSYPQSEFAEKHDSLARDSSESLNDKAGENKDLSWMDKVLYSSYMENLMPPRGFRRALRQRYHEKQTQRDELVVKTTISPPITVKYLMDLKNEENSVDQEKAPVPENNKENVELDDSGGENVNTTQFPFKIVKKTEFIENDEEVFDNQSIGSSCKAPSKSSKFTSIAETLRKQEIDIKSLLDEQPSAVDIFESGIQRAIVNPGVPDPYVPPSDVPCGGCGAMLHCQDQSIPGYISSEIFTKLKKRELREEVCYRCSVLEAHQATLSINVSADDYPRIVSKIKEKYAMVLLLVDLTDFPCSIWPGILDIIGNRRPVFLVGNKVDMLPQDSPDYLKRIEDHLIKCVVEIGMLEANIMHTALISAKTGYGVEKLISSVFKIWKGRGDIFIMGCTNVGKSSLFNAFLKSDLCKPQANDLIQQATISQWPGTTLNLLKFPMTSPHGWRRGLRERRLSVENVAIKSEEKARVLDFKSTRDPELAVLTGHIGRTFGSQQDDKSDKSIIFVNDPFNVSMGPRPPFNHVPKRPGQWDPEDPDLFGHWVYDTPGAVNPNQILDLLTLPELMQSLPKTMIQPRSFFIKPQMSFFVGGLARVDYTEGPAPIRYTLFANNSLPVTMCQTNDADEVYQKAIGSKIFCVPSGNEERLSQFPALKPKLVSLKGAGHTFGCADIVLSSIGWICVTAGRKQEIQLTVHTPEGRGIFIRNVALLPYAINRKGKRIRGTYAYSPHTLYVPKGNTRDS